MGCGGCGGTGMRLVSRPSYPDLPWNNGSGTGSLQAPPVYTTCEYCSIYIDGVPLAQHPSFMKSREPLP